MAKELIGSRFNLPIIKIGMGEGVVAKTPLVIMSEGIGSCVIVALYGARQKIGGMAHIMKPSFDHALSLPVNPLCQYEYADTAINALLKEMLVKGVAINDIIAKIVGGAKMFSSYNGDSDSLGEQNVRSIKNALKEKNIHLKGWDTHGHHGRSVEFYLESGRVVIKTIDKENKEI